MFQLVCGIWVALIVGVIIYDQSYRSGYAHGYEDGKRDGISIGEQAEKARASAEVWGPLD